MDDWEMSVIKALVEGNRLDLAEYYMRHVQYKTNELYIQAAIQNCVESSVPTIIFDAAVSLILAYQLLAKSHIQVQQAYLLAQAQQKAEELKFHDGL